MSKPDVDLNDPQVRALIAAMNARAAAATRAVERMRSAVRAVFAARPDKAGARRAPEHVGSCVLVSLEGEHFLFAAAHVFEHHGSWPVMIGFENSLVALRGERYSSMHDKNGGHAHDPVDAAVFHVAKEDVPANFEQFSLGWRDLYTSPLRSERTTHALIGFRLRETRLVRGVFRSQQDVFPTIEHDDDEYAVGKLDRTSHLSAAWEEQFLVANAWRNSPLPRGMSGGAMVHVAGLEIGDGLRGPASQLVPRLAATLSECRRPRDNAHGALVGARVGLHLGLIAKYCPQLKEWMLTQAAS